MPHVAWVGGSVDIRFYTWDSVILYTSAIFCDVHESGKLA